MACDRMPYAFVAGLLISSDNGSDLGMHTRGQHLAFKLDDDNRFRRRFKLALDSLELEKGVEFDNSEIA